MFVTMGEKKTKRQKQKEVLAIAGIAIGASILAAAGLEVFAAEDVTWAPVIAL